MTKKNNTYLLGLQLLDVDLLANLKSHIGHLLLRLDLGVLLVFDKLVVLMVEGPWLVVVLVVLLNAYLIIHIGLFWLDISRVLRLLLDLVLNFGALLRRLAARLTLLRAQTCSKSVIESV